MDILKAIADLPAPDVDRALEALLDRYRKLYPQWEIHLLSISRLEDRNAQIDRLIDFLKTMKTSR